MADPSVSSWELFRQETIVQIEALELGGLVEFVRHRIEGRDIILSDDPDGSREYPIIAIDPFLKRLVREDLRCACVEVLKEFAAGERADEPSVHSLLLLCQALVPDEAGVQIKAVAESSCFDQLSPALQFRVAQTLVKLGTRLESPFWKRLAARDWSRFASVCWAGLEENSPTEAIDFLAEIPADEAALQKLSYALPGFLKRLYGRAENEALLTRLSHLLPDLPETFRHEVHLWAERFRPALEEPPPVPETLSNHEKIASLLGVLGAVVSLVAFVCRMPLWNIPVLLVITAISMNLHLFLGTDSEDPLGA